MIEEYLKNGELSYFKNIYKKGNSSKDLFEIKYNGKIMYLLCTFDGIQITNTMLIS
jgi:hypothetical protein